MRFACFHALRAYSQALRAEFNGVEATPSESCSLREHKKTKINKN
jgi:hypothetical protein